MRRRRTCRAPHARGTPTRPMHAQREEQMGRMKRSFQRIPKLHKLQKLRWQLILTYILITVVATVTFEAATIIGGVLTLEGSASQPPAGLAKYLAASGQQIA